PPSATGSASSPSTAAGSAEAIGGGPDLGVQISAPGSDTGSQSQGPIPSPVPSHGLGTSGRGRAAFAGPSRASDGGRPHPSTGSGLAGNAAAWPARAGGRAQEPRKDLHGRGARPATC